MKFQITLKPLDSDFPQVPIVVDEADITAHTDWERLFKLSIEEVRRRMIV